MTRQSLFQYTKPQLLNPKVQYPGYRAYPHIHSPGHSFLLSSHLLHPPPTRTHTHNAHPSKLPIQVSSSAQSCGSTVQYSIVMPLRIFFSHSHFPSRVMACDCVCQTFTRRARLREETGGNAPPPARYADTTPPCFTSTSDFFCLFAYFAITVWYGMVGR